MAVAASVVAAAETVGAAWKLMFMLILKRPGSNCSSCNCSLGSFGGSPWSQHDIFGMTTIL